MPHDPVSRQPKAMGTADPESKRVPTAIVVLVILAFSLLLCLHAAYYLPFISDAALISLRYVKRLVAGYGLTWTDGPPVEGYSNLLGMLLLIPFVRLGFDRINSARCLGVLCMAGAISCITR